MNTNTLNRKALSTSGLTKYHCEIIFTFNLVELYSQRYTVDIFSQARNSNGV
jgi:hypothetical protein